MEGSFPAVHSTSILERITDGFVALDRDFQFIYVNEEAARMFMRPKDELMNQCIWSLHPRAEETTLYKEFKRCLEQNGPVQFEHHGLRTGKWYEVRGYPSDYGLSAFFIDVTEKKQMEKEFFRLEALNLIGEISAGLGHEIRNPLTTVKGFLQLLEEMDTEYKYYYGLMIEEIDRANSIITEFLSLASTADNMKVRQVSLNKILDSLAPLIEADALSAKKVTEISKGTIQDLWLYENEIRQLILNLVRNALEAMGTGGKVTICTYEESGEVVLSIADQGTGISPELLDKIWVPFFTTKAKGTGLGLAVSYRIATRHGARIVTETSNGGTTFYVRFKR